MRLHSQLIGVDTYYLQLYTQTVDYALYTFIATKEQYNIHKRLLKYHFYT